MTFTLKKSQVPKQKWKQENESERSGFSFANSPSQSKNNSFKSKLLIFILRKAAEATFLSCFLLKIFINSRGI